MCPHCGQNAPIVYRGVAAFCSACGRQRPPLIAPSVSYAGKPSKVGGTVAGVIGWIVLIVGVSLTIGLSLLLSMLSTTLSLAVGIPFGILTLAVSLTLLFSGKKLKKSGETAQRDMWRRAVIGLAGNRGGAITAAQAAASLNIPPAEADAFLTELAKTEPDEVTLELDDRGGIYYAFPRLLPPGRRDPSMSMGQAPSAGARQARFEDAPRVRVNGAPGVIEGEPLEQEEPLEQQRKRSL